MHSDLVLWHCLEEWSRSRCWKERSRPDPELCQLCLKPTVSVQLRLMELLQPQLTETVAQSQMVLRPAAPFGLELYLEWCQQQHFVQCWLRLVLR